MHGGMLGAMNKLSVSARNAAALLLIGAASLTFIGCGPAGVPDCDEDEELRWAPCGGDEPDTCGSWVCVGKATDSGDQPES